MAQALLKCPVCSGEFTILELYEQWDDELDQRLCEDHKQRLDKIHEAVVGAT